MAAPSSLPFAEAWTRGTDAFDRARQDAIWNARLQRARTPDAIIRCRSAAEVARAVQLAAHERVQVSLRGSGHSYIAAPLRDGGLLLDLGHLDFIEIDAERRTARVGPGTRGGDLAQALSDFGLAFPVGHCSTVALGGYLLAGGIGWNCGEWGPACGHVRAVELVLADGTALVASADHEPELLWAARGAGCGFFAAVTAYHLDLQPLPSAAHLWTRQFTADSAPALADWLSLATAAAHPSAEVMCLLGPDLASGEPCITIRAVSVGADNADAAARIASFRSPPAAAQATGLAEERPLAFTELGQLSAMPDGKRVAADQCWSAASLGTLLLAVQHLAAVPARSSTINLVAPGGSGTIPHMADDTGALSVGGGVSCGIYAMWDDPADDALHMQWVRDADQALAPYYSARYVGEADLTRPGHLVGCFTPAALERIEALRRRWDPQGLFNSGPDVAA